VFEDKALAEQAVMAVEKVINNDDVDAVTLDTKRAQGGQTELVEEIPAQAPSKV
jgi:hypothetical protein